MVRSLLFDFSDDPIARGVSDQFLLGRSLLVCPVTEPWLFGKDGEPITTGAGVRACYLPAGTGWYDFWTGDYADGGQTVMAAAPLDQPPVFVRAGTVLPLQAPVSHALENRDAFEVVIYPGADGAGRLYDDDGLTHEYQDGNYTLIEFSWNDRARCVTVEALSWARALPMVLCLRVAHETREIAFDGTATRIWFGESA